MLQRKLMVGIILGVILQLYSGLLFAYSFCGFHDRTFQMRAYHFNSEFWVDQLQDQVDSWNQVHNVIRLTRERRASVPVGNDGNNVISWINEQALMNNYNLSWNSGGTVGWTISRLSGNCGRITESDVFFWPGISQFTEQDRVPYSLGFQEIALHELGHVVTLDHEDRDLAVMTAGAAVSDVLYTSDKVGWLRSADFRFSVADRRDMGIFPLSNNGTSKNYGQATPTNVRTGDTVTIRDITVQNLSSGLTFDNPRYSVILDSITSNQTRNIGSFSWGSFCAFCEWSGDLDFRIGAVPAGTYDVVVRFQNSDSDSTNDEAIFRRITVVETFE